MQFFDATGARKCARVKLFFPNPCGRRVLGEQTRTSWQMAMPVAKILIFGEFGGRTRTRTLDPKSHRDLATLASANLRLVPQTPEIPAQ